MKNVNIGKTLGHIDIPDGALCSRASCPSSRTRSW